MKVAVTGGTGFIGHYIIHQLLNEGHQLSCWYRDDNKIPDSLKSAVDWQRGVLGDQDATEILVRDADAVVHAALWKPGPTFRGGEGEVVEFCRHNVLGSLQLIEAARQAGAAKFVFLSTCAVHEQILEDRPLDERHPLWPLSHYGAHKAAIEKFVHSYGFGQGFDICALRPTGVYGLNHPLSASKWYRMIRQLLHDQPVKAEGGGKEVHAADVAKAVSRLLGATDTAGQCYNCYDMYVANLSVAEYAKQLIGSNSEIHGPMATPRHQIETGKIRGLGMTFGGQKLLHETLGQLVAAMQQELQLNQ